MSFSFKVFFILLSRKKSTILRVGSRTHVFLTKALAHDLDVAKTSVEVGDLLGHGVAFAAQTPHGLLGLGADASHLGGDAHLAAQRAGLHPRGVGGGAWRSLGAGDEDLLRLLEHSGCRAALQGLAAGARDTRRGCRAADHRLRRHAAETHAQARRRHARSGPKGKACERKKTTQNFQFIKPALFKLF